MLFPGASKLSIENKVSGSSFPSKFRALHLLFQDSKGQEISKSRAYLVNKVYWSTTPLLLCIVYMIFFLLHDKVIAVIEII